jgi:CDP-4-dehydro-6-deoxyglucose reductase
MTQMLSIWRAAQVVGVSRGVMQKKIREGELHSSEGMVSTDELLRVFSHVVIKEPGDLERVTKIKEESFGRRVRERMLPSQEVLAQRLFSQSQELADLRRHLQSYHDLVMASLDRVRELSASAGNGVLQDLGRFLEKGLSDVLATESADVLTIMDDMLKVMSAHVTVRPSGREFSVEGHDTLLQAGLSAGLHLNYGCGNGTCGLCKARVIAGDVARVMPHDYQLSEAEKLQGYTLLCAHTAASSDLVIETLEALGPQDIPDQQIVTRVRALRPLGADTLLLHLQTPRTNRLRFLAGQGVTLGMTLHGEDVHGAYPIASCPCDDRNLHFYIARDNDDAFACQLFGDTLKVGDAVTVWGPQGDFVLAENQRPLVFLACDTGFAPARGMLEHAMAADSAESLSLYWLATRPDGHFLENQCRAWTDALDNFDYSLHAETDVVAGTHALVGAMKADVFMMRCDFYIAGPELFIETAKRDLLAAGVPEQQIFSTVV